MLSLQDERDITAVINRYATGIGKRDFKLFRTCFAEGFTAFYEPNWKMAGGDEITKIMDEGHRDFGKTLHRNTNIVIEEAPDGAKSRTYVNAVLTYPDGRVAVVNEGYYDDTFVREGGVWKMKTRYFVPVRSEGEARHVEMVFPKKKP